MFYKRIIRIIRRESGTRVVAILLLKTVQLCRILYYRILSDNNIGHSQAILKQPVLFVGRGAIKLGKCHIGLFPSPYFISTYAHFEARSLHAEITIGDDSWVNNNAVIIADKTRIEIGDNVLIGPNFFACDSDFHALSPKMRTTGEYKAKPIVIENNVFLGANVTVLKGVTIGKNSVIAAGSMVTKNIPSNVVAGGIPAEVIDRLLVEL